METLIKIYYVVSNFWRSVFGPKTIFDSVYDASYSRQAFLKTLPNSKGLKRKTKY